MRRGLYDQSRDADFWRGRPAAERLAAVEDLRRQQQGDNDAARPRRNEAASGRPQDIADLAALQE